jgi:hypothetical protein
MKTFALLLIALGFVTALTAADAPAPPPAKGFDAFKLVKTRNIFDPDRRAMASASTPGRSSLTTRANFIALTGTMVAEGKMLAFFSGSRAEYSKVISVGDSIADFKVTDITTSQVELEHAGKSIAVAVGKQIPLEGSSAAITVEPAAANAATPPADGAAAAPSDASTPAEPKPAAPADSQADLIKRMMERREKELSK